MKDRFSRRPFRSAAPESNRSAAVVCGGLFLAWLAVCFLSAVLKPQFLEAAAQKADGFPLVMLGVLLALAGMLGLTAHRLGERKDARVCLTLFLGALALRLILLPGSQALPASDFINYYNIGVDFAKNGFDGTVDITRHYGIPAFAGLKVLNGLIGRIFSPTVLGYQVANSVMTASICVAIFLLGRRICRLGAVLGGCLYAVYPSDLLSTQQLTNHHGATLFLLLGLYWYAEALFPPAGAPLSRRKWCLLCGGSALALLVSNYFHPSALIALLAMAAYTLCALLGQWLEGRRRTKRMGTLAAALAAVLLVYNCAGAVSMAFLRSRGLLGETMRHNTLLAKFVVGLNRDTGGWYSDEDYTYIYSFPEAQQPAVALDMIRARLDSPRAVAGLMARKLSQYTFGGDNYFDFYAERKLQQLTEQAAAADAAYARGEIGAFLHELETDRIAGHIDAIRLWVDSFRGADNVMLAGTYIFALVGLLWALRRKVYDTVYLLWLLPTGWSMFVTLTEMQTRYRYQSMPIVMLFAGFGLAAIWRRLKRGRGQSGEKSAP